MPNHKKTKGKPFQSGFNRYNWHAEIISQEKEERKRDRETPSLINDNEDDIISDAQEVKRLKRQVKQLDKAATAARVIIRNLEVKMKRRNATIVDLEDTIRTLKEHHVDLDIAVALKDVFFFSDKEVWLHCILSEFYCVLPA